MASDVVAVRHVLGILDRHTFRTIDHAVLQFRDHRDRFRESLVELRSFRDTVCGELSAAFAAAPCSVAAIKDSAKADLNASFGQDDVENQGDRSYGLRSRAARKPKAAEAPQRVTRSRARNVLPKGGKKELGTEAGDTKQSSAAAEAVTSSRIREDKLGRGFERELEISGIACATRQLEFPDVPRTQSKLAVSEVTDVLSTGNRKEPKKMCREGDEEFTSMEGEHSGSLQLSPVALVNSPSPVVIVESPPRHDPVVIVESPLKQTNEHSIIQPSSVGVSDDLVKDNIHVKKPEENGMNLKQDIADLDEETQSETYASTQKGASRPIGHSSEGRYEERIETVSELSGRYVSRCSKQSAVSGHDVGGVSLDEGKASPSRKELENLGENACTEQDDGDSSQKSKNLSPGSDELHEDLDSAGSDQLHKDLASAGSDQLHEDLATAGSDHLHENQASAGCDQLHEDLIAAGIDRVQEDVASADSDQQHEDLACAGTDEHEEDLVGPKFEDLAGSILDAKNISDQLQEAMASADSDKLHADLAPAGSDEHQEDLVASKLEDLTGSQLGARDMNGVPQMLTVKTVSQDSKVEERSPALSRKKERLFRDSILQDTQDRHQPTGPEEIKYVGIPSIQDSNGANRKRKSSFQGSTCRDSGNNLSSRGKNTVSTDAMESYAERCQIFQLADYRDACNLLESQELGSTTFADENRLGNVQLTPPNICSTLELNGMKPWLSGNEEIPAYPFFESSCTSRLHNLRGSGAASCMKRIQTFIEDLGVQNLVVPETPRRSLCQPETEPAAEKETSKIMVHHEVELCGELMADSASNISPSIPPNVKDFKEHLGSRNTSLSTKLAVCTLEDDPKDMDCSTGSENGVQCNFLQEGPIISVSNKAASLLSVKEVFLECLEPTCEKRTIDHGGCLPIPAEMESFQFVEDEELYSPHSSKRAFRFTDTDDSTIPVCLTNIVAEADAKCTPKEKSFGDGLKFNMLSAERTVNSSRRKRARTSDFSLESMNFFKKIKISVNDNAEQNGGTKSSPEASLPHGFPDSQLPYENSLTPNRFKVSCGSPIHGLLQGSHCNKVLGFDSTHKQEKGGNKLYQSHSGVLGVGTEYVATPRFRFTASESGTSSVISRSQKLEMRLVAHAEEDEQEAEAKEIPWSALAKSYAEAATQNKSKVSKYPNLIASARKRYNLAASGTSFLDLIHQKQAQASAPYPNGKREVKVKALEAAELAKRQEEKREYERKMRRMECYETTKCNFPEQAAAAGAGKVVHDKVKRAAELKMKLDQEKARKQGEEQRRKEDERRKREAELADKKRKREDADKREREEKRKRVEEVQKLKKEQEERQRLELDEKESKRRMLEEKERKRKAQEEEAKKQKRREKEKEAERRRKQEEMSKTVRLAEKQAERKRKEAIVQARPCDDARKCSDLSSTESLCVMRSSTDWELQPNNSVLIGSGWSMLRSMRSSHSYAGKLSTSFDNKTSICSEKLLPTNKSSIGCQEQVFPDSSHILQPATTADMEGGVQSYEISPYKSSDDEDEEDNDRPKKPVPWWARKENLLPQVIWQQNIDPDEIFSTEKTCSLAEIFGTDYSRRCRNFNQRGTSGDWLVDHATWKEEQEYKRTMGYIQN